MGALFWGSIEISVGPAEEGNPPGMMVLFLFAIAIVLAVIGHYIVPGTLWRKAFATGLSLDDDGNARARGRTRTYRDTRFAPSGTDKRIHVRRGGDPVPIWISASPDGAAQKDALVLDRSRSGLLVSSDEPCSIGEYRYVRALNAPEDMEWIPIEIRHCRQRDGRYLLGCKFKTELPWSIILMFG